VDPLLDVLPSPGDGSVLEVSDERVSALALESANEEANITALK
jgi:hypothetical protein